MHAPWFKCLLQDTAQHYESNFRVDFWRSVNVGTSITNDIENEITYSPQKTKWKKKKKVNDKREKKTCQRRENLLLYFHVCFRVSSYHCLFFATVIAKPTETETRVLIYFIYRPTSRFMILGLKPKIPDQRKQFILDFSEFMFKNKPGPSPDNKCKPSIAPCKRKQQCWPTTSNIVGCYMLRPFAHPVACCCVLLGVVAQSLKPVKLLGLGLVGQQCWELLRPFARSLLKKGQEEVICMSFQSPRTRAHVSSIWKELKDIQHYLELLLIAYWRLIDRHDYFNPYS